MRYTCDVKKKAIRNEPNRFPSKSGKRESDPRHRPWQGRALPLSYSRKKKLLFYCTGRVELCEKRDLNPHAEAPDPKSGVSANSTTLAYTVSVHFTDSPTGKYPFNELQHFIEVIPLCQPHFHPFYSEPRRDRTFDPQIKSLLLYQLS